MKKALLVLPFLGIVSICALAEPYSANDASQAAIVAEKIAIRDTLRADLVQIESEQSRCEKSKGTWKTVTIIGGVGAAATGIGAIIQAKKIGDKKKELNELNSQ